MMTKKHILCSIDFSPKTTTVIEYAVTLAKCFNAKLTVLTVVEEIAVSSMQIDTEREHAAYQRVSKILKEYDIKQEQIKIVTGYSKKVILDVAKSLRVDLIVMGSHGHYGITRHLIGSTTRIIVNEADCDVYIVRC